jgi:hypothetical protein
MALVGLSEAAKLTGRNQTTIHRAVKTGRLSYTVDEAGARRFDTAELDRVFGIKVNGAILDAMAQPVQSHVTPVREIELLNRLLDDRDATIRDLCARLDVEAEKRRRVQAQFDRAAGRPARPARCRTSFASHLAAPGGEVADQAAQVRGLPLSERAPRCRRRRLNAVPGAGVPTVSRFHESPPHFFLRALPYETPAGARRAPEGPPPRFGPGRGSSRGSRGPRAGLSRQRCRERLPRPGCALKSFHRRSDSSRYNLQYQRRPDPGGDRATVVCLCQDLAAQPWARRPPRIHCASQGPERRRLCRVVRGDPEARRDRALERQARAVSVPGRRLALLAADRQAQLAARVQPPHQPQPGGRSPEAARSGADQRLLEPVKPSSQSSHADSPVASRTRPRRRGRAGQCSRQVVRGAPADRQSVSVPVA